MGEIEVKRIITVKVTVIANGEEYIPATEEAKQEFAEEIKDFIHADDVVVTRVQDFIKDKEGVHNG